MVVFNYSGKEINAKIVYYGPGLSGKTTNLEKIYGHVPEGRRGKMVSMKTRSDRTLFFDFLPVNAGDIRGFRTRFLLYTVPGQVHYNATRKLVLKGTDAIIFVADSDPALRQANKESMLNLEQNLAEYQLSLDKIPVILQYNKRDLPNAMTVDELNEDLNPRGWPWYEAVSVRNEGVWETFRAATRSLFESLQKTLGGEEEAESKEAESPAAGGTDDSADPRFSDESQVFDVGAAGDDVVRISGSLDGWGPDRVEEPKSSGTDEVVSGATGGDRHELEKSADDPDRSPIPLAGGLPAEDEHLPNRSPVHADDPSSVPPVSPADEHGRRAADVAAPPQRVEAKAAADASGQAVVQVPVQLDKGRGSVRVEIVLEIELHQEEKRDDRSEKASAPAEPAASLDTGGTWS